MTNDLITVPAAADDIPLEVFRPSHFSLFAAMAFPDDQKKAAIYVAHWSFQSHGFTRCRRTGGRRSRRRRSAGKRGTKAGAVVRDLWLLGAAPVGTMR